MIHDSFRAGVGLLVLIGLLACGCSDSSGGGAADTAGDAAVDASIPAEPEVDAIAVRTEEVIRAPISALYSTSATLRADKQTTVTARTRGVIRRLLVEEGDTVEADQLLAELEDDEQKIEAERARMTFDTRWREFERARTLNEQGLTSDEAFETIRRDAQEARHAADLADLVLSRTRIRALYGGQILRRHVDVGETVSDGTVIFDLVDRDPLYADVSVPERQVARLAPGQEVRLIADATGTEASARIERIAPGVDPATATIKVTLAVRPIPGLRPGSFARVEIVTETHDAALTVPRSALVAEGRRWHLFRVGGQGDTVERVEVLRGFEERDRVEILSVVEEGGALQVGDRVVHVGASALTDGARVQVMEPEADATRVDS